MVCRFLYAILSIRFITVLLLSGWVQASLSGQTADSIPVPEVPLDTSPVYWITAAVPEERYLFDDTLIGYAFRMYDPARKADWADWGNLGLLGSPARRIFFETAPRVGFASGFSSFNLYRLYAEDLRFFKHTRTFSQVGFTQGRTQNDNSLDAVFSRSFSGGATLALAYQSTFNIGQYQYQSARNNAFVAGVELPVGKRYEGFITLAINSNRQQENGGITADADFGSGTFSGPINAPIRLATQRALSRYAARNGQYTHYFRFTGQNTGRQFRAGHTIGYGEETAKFAHEFPASSDSVAYSDTLFYDTFMVDKRGLRQFSRFIHLDNHFQLTTYKSRTEGKLSDELAAGIRYNRITVEQEPGDTLITNWFLTGTFSLTPSERFRFAVQGQLGLFENLSEYQLTADLSWQPGQLGRIRAGLISRRYPPAWIFHRLNVSGQPFWNNDFEKPVETAVWATYELPGKRAPLRLMARSQLINNFLYFDTLGLARQTGEPVLILQAGAEVQLTWRFLHLDQTLCVQQTNREDVLRVPTWFSRSALYFDGFIFKQQLQFSTGFDFRINSRFQPDAWQPLTGQFQLNDAYTQEPYAWLDAFVAFKIQTFRFFFRYENFGTLLWNDNAIFAQTAWHPQLFNTFRLGLSWRFLD